MTGENTPPVLTVPGSHSLCPAFIDSCDPQNGGCERVSCVMERIPSLRDRVWGADCGGSEGRPLMGMVVWGSERNGYWAVRPMEALETMVRGYL